MAQMGADGGVVKIKNLILRKVREGTESSETEGIFFFFFLGRDGKPDNRSATGSTWGGVFLTAKGREGERGELDLTIKPIPDVVGVSSVIGVRSRPGGRRSRGAVNDQAWTAFRGVWSRFFAVEERVFAGRFRSGATGWPISAETGLL